ncbi:DEAD/DEAH box helicase [Pyrococcus yayanosii]|uniref:Large helicase-related protein n=1 Tax=Pyrococcus yayanosii (strain CH1 / JCM 16557) TaxID=529709 RepID=F8AEQ9_PYRYC|nr:DEAD/DEAH box helicase [Pyrococcus yayanosii]AEH24741.1 Large helicase-related protein [Pyrococcus yayanosii CH1]
MHITLRKAVREKFGSLNELQIKAFREIKAGKSVLIIAPTGSGKTEAAFLPVLDTILKEGLKPIAALYIAPLKALNRDLLERLEWWGEKTGVRVEVRHGDTPQSRRARQVRNPPHVLIITPETLGIILTMNSLRPYLRNVRYVIVDEVAELVDNKRGAQLILNLERLALLADFQRIGLSATIGNEREVMEWLGAEIVVKPSLRKEYSFTVLFPAPDERDADLAERLKVPIDVAARLRVLWEIVERHERALIFVNTRQFAEVLAHRLKVWGKPVEVHHGSLSREARVEAERKLKEGKVKALVCTSSMELGIDIGDVDVVIQYMSPRQVNRLIQRAGRSRHRLGEVSEAYVIATSVEDYLQSLVIAKRVLEGKLEPVRPYKNALDVLAHFVIGLLIENRTMKVWEPYQVAKRAYPYKELEWEDYLKVIRMLEEANIISQDEEGNLKLRRNAYRYYFENLSTIPDEVSYRVLDVTSGRVIGRIDESFAMNLTEGVEFIMHGRSWVVLEINEEAFLIKVRESGNVEGAVPSWEGEMIPVPFEIAREVGRLRRELVFDMERGKRLIKGVKFREEELRRAVEILRKQEPLPTDRDVCVESLPKFLVIHADFGNNVNEALGRFVWALLSLKYGKIFAFRAQAHTLVFRTPFQLNPEEVKGYLTMGAGRLREFVAASLREGPIYRWRMLNVARRMGALRRNARIKAVEKLFGGTIIEKETLNELFHDKIDVERAEKVLEEIREGKIRVRTMLAKEPSPLASANITVGGEFLVAGGLDRDELLEIFRRRLLDSSIVLVCTNCGKAWETRVGRLEERAEELKCPACGSIMLAPLHPKDAEEFQKALKKMRRGKSLSPEEVKAYRKGLKASDLLRSYGFDAILALATYGVGPGTATRLLAQYRGAALLLVLMEAEKQFIRTKRFWR